MDQLVLLPDEFTPQRGIEGLSPAGVNHVTQHVQIFSAADVEKLRQGLAANRERSRQLGPLKLQLEEAIPYKPLATVPANYSQWVTELRHSFPNCQALLDYLTGEFALSQVAGGPLRLPPLLLVGPPGVGKTEIVYRLASAFDTECLKLDMAHAQTSSALVGSDKAYGNSVPGRLFHLLAFGKTANPVVILDELDKARGDRQFSAATPLYALLEPTSARHFQDLSVPEISFDARHITWIATANDIRTIDPPILDRFVVINVREPNQAETQTIAKNIYANLLSLLDCTKYFRKSLDKEVLAILGEMPPRKIRRVLRSAMGRAATENRQCLVPTDIDTGRASQTGRIPMGFI